jgi:hypothetical protein
MFGPVARSLFATVILMGGGLSHGNAAPLLPMGWVTPLGVSNVAFGVDPSDIIVATNPPVPIVSISGTGGSASLQFSPTPTPTITANATGYNVADNASAFAQGLFQYFGIVDAPGGAVLDTTVNVTSTGSLFSEAGVVSFGSNALAKLSVFGTTLINRVSDQGADTGSFSTTQVVPVKTNLQFAVEMQVRAWTFEPGMSATAILDPYFSLDQNLIDLGYTLRFSDGAGNSLAVNEVPLPAAFPLFVTGLGVIGLLGWRRKRIARASLPD